MKKDDWTEVFEIRDTKGEKHFTKPYISPWDANEPLQFIIWNKKSDCEQGKYRDYGYAVKQARHKYKKMLKRVERLLLG